MQSRTFSAIEAATNTGVGFILSWLVGWFVFPLFGFAQSGGEVTLIVLIFTVVSFARSYILRRVFNVFR